MSDAIVFSERWEDSLLALLNDNEVDLFVSVDTGATNTRVQCGTRDRAIDIGRFRCKTVTTLIAQLTEIGNLVSAVIRDKAIVRAGSIGAAGPVVGGKKVDITNYDEGDRALELKDLPESLFPQLTSRILNDLESAAYGILGLSQRKNFSEFFHCFRGGDSCPEELPYLHQLICAVGTGLGVGALLALPNSGAHSVLPLESGHVHFHSLPPTHPRYEEERSMISFISNNLYKGVYPLEYEDLVSGRGLTYLYEWAIKDAPDLSPLPAEEISKKAQDGSCPYAEKALLYHYRYLARVSAHLSVILQTKGIFWLGDNQVANDAFVQKHKECLIEEFLFTTKREWIENIPIITQKQRFNINLEGAMYVSRTAY